MNDYDLSAYLSVFLDEADEQLQILDEKILSLEKDPFNVEIVQSIFRAAHTLKGSSASMGFDKLKEFTHQLENVFEQIRQQHVTVNGQLINVLFESIDLIKDMKEAIVHNRLDEINIEHGMQALEQFVQPCANEGTAQPFVAKQPFELQDYHKEIFKQGMMEGYAGYHIKVTLLPDASMKNVRAFMVYSALTNQGEIIATNPAAEVMEQDEAFDGLMEFSILSKATKDVIQQIVQRISDVQSVTIEEMINSAPIEESVQQPLLEDVPLQASSKISPTIRVDVDKLEHLMGLVGELVINQTRLVDVRGRFAEKTIRFEREFDVLNEVTNQLSLVISELQDGMVQTRMLPIEQLFNRFPRLVRDTCMKANKEVEFDMLGKETELDRTLIEEISDPLIHLLRNAIDHGIECGEERLKQGKPATGKVLLSAEHEEKHVVIKIQDDGKGIDPEKIKEASVKKGIITQEEAKKLNDKEAMFLIFKSGISTADQVTDISGRGVGMDIVKSHIEKINGIIDIESNVGEGTTFTIRLPLTLTLSIIRALLIKLGNKTFAIPLINVLEIIRINKDEIQMVKNQEVGMVRGRVLPLVRMKQQLHIEEDELDGEKNREFVVVVGFADKRVGIVVDKTIGNQEIVTKSLGSYIGAPPFISGATIMGDANVALILDVALIVREFGSKMLEVQERVNEQRVNEMNQLVTFKLDSEEYGIEIHRAKDIVPMTTITRVVESAPEVLGIINLRGKTLPVIDLRKRLGLPATHYTKKARIIVVEYDRQDVGFLVDEVTQVFKIDHVHMEQHNDENSNHTSKLVKNISKLENRIVFILNFDAIIKTIPFQHFN